MELISVRVICVIFLVRVASVDAADWSNIRCASEPVLEVSEGVQPLDRFRWLGIIQHNFDVDGVLKFAVTSAILIHPGFAVAPAEDISKIRIESFSNTTKLILWHSASLKYAIDVVDYVLHPEFVEGLTSASLAVVELFTYGETGLTGNPKPCLPICIPLKGTRSYAHAFAAKMSDENKELQKELFQMIGVDDDTCTKFYTDHQLNQPKLAPVEPNCAKVEHATAPCVWDAGVALISKEIWGYWTLIGFGARGPGCGAPARFLGLPEYLSWINDVISPDEGHEGMTRLGYRRLSPYQIQLYDAKIPMNPETGQCERRSRGAVQYKEYTELTSTKTFSYGFFFIAVSQIASYSCCIVRFDEALGRSTTSVWVEHNCHIDAMGAIPRGRKEKLWENERYVLDQRRLQCFMYFKTTAFIEFRFYFSFSITYDVTLYGKKDANFRYPDVEVAEDTTSKWYPTQRLFGWTNWQPIGVYM